MSFSSFRFSLVLVMGVVVGFSFGLGSSVLADRSEVRPSSAASLPLSELRDFTEVLGQIKRDYVEEVTDKELLQNAIRGMLSGLDPHSNFLDQDEYKDLQAGTSGEFGGLGIEVGMEDGFVKVISPIDDTPAQRAGMEAGDLIIRLDDTPVKGLTLGEAVKIMRGKPGTDIVLTVVREGADKPFQVTITRDVIKVKSVKSRILDKGYGYVRITSFQTRTTEQVAQAVEELTDEAKGELMGLVLDLRNNPGGVLGAAVGVSDLFLEDGLIVYTEGRTEDAKLSFSATPDDILTGAPIVILINGGTASASEIVSGALQDHKRAIVMGTRSFGKGSVQTIFPMSNNETAVKLTTARYFTPAGRSIQAEGIAPDVELEPLQVARAEQEDFATVKEADLSGHLTNGNGHDEADKKKSGKGDGDKASKKESLAAKDYELYEALTLLKGLSILQSRH